MSRMSRKCGGAGPRGAGEAGEVKWEFVPTAAWLHYWRGQRQKDVSLSQGATRGRDNEAPDQGTKRDPGTRP